MKEGWVVKHVRQLTASFVVRGLKRPKTRSDTYRQVGEKVDAKLKHRQGAGPGTLEAVVRANPPRAAHSKRATGQKRPGSAMSFYAGVPRWKALEGRWGARVLLVWWGCVRAAKAATRKWLPGCGRQMSMTRSVEPQLSFSGGVLLSRQATRQVFVSLGRCND